MTRRTIGVLYKTYVLGVNEVQKPKVASWNSAVGHIFKHGFEYSLTHSSLLIAENKDFSTEFRSFWYLGSFFLKNLRFLNVNGTNRFFSQNFSEKRERNFELLRIWNRSKVHETVWKFKYRSENWTNFLHFWVSVLFTILVSPVSKNTNSPWKSCYWNVLFCDSHIEGLPKMQINLKFFDVATYFSPKKNMIPRWNFFKRPIMWKSAIKF